MTYKRSKVASSTIPYYLPHVLIGFLSLSVIGFLMVFKDPPFIRTSLPVPPVYFLSSQSNYYNKRFLRVVDTENLKGRHKKRSRSDVTPKESDLKAGIHDGSSKKNTASFVAEFDDLVHVINTRFMQLQGNLTDLGQARLEIFRHFCLPTIVHQTASNFIWIIRTDPKLDESIKTQLIELLAPFPNFILVANNENPEYFREVSDVINSTQVLSGSIDIAKMYHEAAKSRHVLETRLDSDDGLASNTLKQLQASAGTAFQIKDESNKSMKKSWTIWCLDRTLEWHMKYNVKESSSGLIIPHVSDMCLTPGLTVGFPPDVTRKEMPTMKHQKLHTIVPICSHIDETKCIHKITSKSDLTSGAIRVRSPTSSGMSNVLAVPKSIQLKWEKYQEKFWVKIPEVFSIEEADAVNLNKYLSDNIRNIAEDNLKGQCTKGHSCKKESKEKLKIIIDKTNNQLIQ